MELVGGVSLANVLDEGPVPDDDAWRIAAEVCQALHAAHRAGVTHGNLKPSNVLIADEGAVKVGGFTGGGGSRQDMYSLGLLMEAMLGRRDPIVKRLLSRNPYSPAQLHEILTGSTLDDRGEVDGGDDDSDDADRPRLVRLAVISGLVTLAAVVACTWFLSPSAPPDLQSDGASGGLPSSLSGRSDQPAPAPAATSRPPAASVAANPGNSAGNNTGNPGNAAINAVKAVIANELNAGQIEPDAADSLNNKLDDVARFQSRGQTKQANDRIDSLKSQLAAMRKANKLTAKGYDEILASLNGL